MQFSTLAISSVLAGPGPPATDRMTTQQRVAVVTGANKGIGFAAVKQLASQFDGVVYLGSRDKGRGEAAVEQLRKDGIKGTVELGVIDITCPQSRQAFHDFVKEKHGGIDIIINNAAIAFANAATEPLGFQAKVTLATNYEATRDFTQLMLSLLRPHARVVNVSSSAGHLTFINGQEPQAGKLRATLADPNLTVETLDMLCADFKKRAEDGTYHVHGWPGRCYSVSKILLSALTRVQQREIDNERPGDDIVFNAVHPGYVSTDMTKHRGTFTPERGAKVLVHCALLPKNVKEPRGGYVWHDCTIADFTAETRPAE